MEPSIPTRLSHAAGISMLGFARCDVEWSNKPKTVVSGKFASIERLSDKGFRDLRPWQRIDSGLSPRRRNDEMRNNI